MFNRCTAAFSYDEMNVLNNIGINVSLKDAMNSVLTQVVITRDKKVKMILLELNSKLRQLTDEEWEEIQQYLPFEMPYMNEDLNDDLTDMSGKDTAKFERIIEEMEAEQTFK